MTLQRFSWRATRNIYSLVALLGLGVLGCGHSNPGPGESTRDASTPSADADAEFFVTLVSPAGGEAVFGETEFRWSLSAGTASSSASLTLELATLDENGVATSTETLATGIDPSQSFYLWDSTPFGSDSLSYTLKVVLQDGDQRASDSSAPFHILAPTTSALGWSDVEEFFIDYCTECHGQPARSQNLEHFRLDKYNVGDNAAPPNDDPGAYEMRSDIYNRLIVVGSMPPASEAQPTQSELDDIAEWLLAGAPN